MHRHLASTSSLSARTRRRIAAVVLGSAALLSLGTSATVSHAQPSSVAQDRERARALVHSGRDKRQGGQNAEALEDFKRAHAIMSLPTTGLEVARTQIELGQLAEAHDTLIEVARSPMRAGEPPVFAHARAEAQALAETVASRLAAARAASSEAAGVTVGGARASASASPTPAPAQASTPAAAPAPAPARAAQAPAAGLLTGSSAASPASLPESRTNPLTYVGGGVLGAGVVVGAVTGAITLVMHADVKDRCGSGCTADTASAVDQGKTFGTVSTVAFAAAGAGAVLLVYGLLFPKTVEGRSALVGRTPGAISF
jgi:hypothetical protein